MMLIMTKKQPQELVTKALFEKEIGTVKTQLGTLETKFGTLDKKVDTLDKKVDTLDKKVDTLDKKVDHVALTVVKNHEEFLEFKKTVATKDDIHIILNRIDSFTTRIETFDRKVIVHDERLNKVETQL